MVSTRISEERHHSAANQDALSYFVHLVKLFRGIIFLLRRVEENFMPFKVLFKAFINIYKQQH